MWKLNDPNLFVPEWKFFKMWVVRKFYWDVSSAPVKFPLRVLKSELSVNVRSKSFLT